MRKPSYKELYESVDRDGKIDQLLTDGVIDFKYCAGFNSYCTKRQLKVLLPHLPDKERPSRDFVLLSALTVLDEGLSPVEAMEYSAKYLNKPDGYVDKMKNETFKDMKSVVKDLSKHPYKRIMLKYRHWQGNSYKKTSTPSALTNILYKDVQRTKHTIKQDERITQLETTVREHEMRLKYLEDTKLSKEDKMVLAKELRLLGWTIKELMCRFEVSKRTIQYWLK